MIPIQLLSVRPQVTIVTLRNKDSPYCATRIQIGISWSLKFKLYSKAGVREGVYIPARFYGSRCFPPLHKGIFLELGSYFQERGACHQSLHRVLGTHRLSQSQSCNTNIHKDCCIILNTPDILKREPFLS